MCFRSIQIHSKIHSKKYIVLSKILQPYRCVTILRGQQQSVFVWDCCCLTLKQEILFSFSKGHESRIKCLHLQDREKQMTQFLSLGTRNVILKNYNSKLITGMVIGSLFSMIKYQDKVSFVTFKKKNPRYDVV